MPRVPRSSLVRLASPPERVAAAAVDRLGATPSGDGLLHVAALHDTQPAIDVTLRLETDGTGTRCTIESKGALDVPIFGWFFWPLVRLAHRRARAHAGATLQAALAGAPPPARPKQVIALPPVAFTADQARLVAAAAAATAVVAFGGALFGQLNSPISRAFHASDAALGDATAITRVGALFALVAIAVADRRGRRRSILVGVVGSALACAVSAVAPGLAVLTGAQIFERGFVGTTAILPGRPREW